jgi:hypothetical protein
VVLKRKRPRDKPIELLRGRIIPAQYASSAPTLLCGVVQINMVVPAGLPPGPFQFAPWAVMSRFFHPPHSALHQSSAD